MTLEDVLDEMEALIERQLRASERLVRCEISAEEAQVVRAQCESRRRQLRALLDGGVAD